MLDPTDYSPKIISDPAVTALMNKITLTKGGQDMETKFLEGIPARIEITLENGSKLDSGVITYPYDQQISKPESLRSLLNHKLQTFGSLGINEKDLEPNLVKLAKLETLPNEDIRNLYLIPLKYAEKCIDV